MKFDKGIFLIGGGIDPGETEHECIVRECIEETGCQVEIRRRICSAEVDHAFRWIDIESVQSQMFLKMQSWAIMQVWRRERTE